MERAGLADGGTDAACEETGVGNGLGLTEGRSAGTRPEDADDPGGTEPAGPSDARPLVPGGGRMEDRVAPGGPGGVDLAAMPAADGKELEARMGVFSMSAVESSSPSSVGRS